MGNSSIEEIIRRAMEEGKFDNLPGKGRPLTIEDNPYEDPEWRMAHQVLRSGGFSLPWIETLRDIEASLAEARRALERAWIWQRASLVEGKDRQWVECEWGRAQVAFREQVTALNTRIQSYNLTTPSIRFQIPLVTADREIKLITRSPKES